MSLLLYPTYSTTMIYSYAGSAYLLGLPGLAARMGAPRRVPTPSQNENRRRESRSRVPNSRHPRVLSWVHSD